VLICVLICVLMQARTLRLFDEFVSADGRGVDFKRMASSHAMRVYLAAAARLSDTSLLARYVGGRGRERRQVCGGARERGWDVWERKGQRGLFFFLYFSFYFFSDVREGKGQRG